MGMPPDNNGNGDDFDCPETLLDLNTLVAQIIPHLGANTIGSNAIAALNAAVAQIHYACPPPLPTEQLRRMSIAHLWTAIGNQRGLMSEEFVDKIHHILEKLGDEPPPPHVPAYAPMPALFTPWGIYPWQPQNLPVKDDIDWEGRFGEPPDFDRPAFRSQFSIVWRDGWWVKLPERSHEHPFAHGEPGGDIYGSQTGAGVGGGPS
jgi:hypothetical protein